MSKVIGVLVILLLMPAYSHAQKWAVRIGFNNLTSHCDVNVKSMNDPSGNTSIYAGGINYVRVFRKFIEIPMLTNFWDISVIRNFNKRHSIIMGFRNMEPLVYSTISHSYSNDRFVVFTSRHRHAQGVPTPTLKLNYINTFLQKEKVNASSLAFFTGITIHFKRPAGSFGNGQWASSVGVLDSSGNLYDYYISAHTAGVRQPKYPVPYLNAGIEGSLRLGKRFKAGLELVGYIGPRTLYVQEVSGETNDAKFTYEIKLKPYFISGGIFIQYRIK